MPNEKEKTHTDAMPWCNNHHIVVGGIFLYLVSTQYIFDVLHSIQHVVVVVYASIFYIFQKWSDFDCFTPNFPTLFSIFFFSFPFHPIRMNPIRAAARKIDYSKRKWKKIRLDTSTCGRWSERYILCSRHGRLFHISGNFSHLENRYSSKIGNKNCV